MLLTSAPEAALPVLIELARQQSSHNLWPTSLLYVPSKNLYVAKWTTKSFKSQSKEALPPNSLSFHKAHTHITENALRRRTQILIFQLHEPFHMQKRILSSPQRPSLLLSVLTANI